MNLLSGQTEAASCFYINWKLVLCRTRSSSGAGPAGGRGEGPCTCVSVREVGRDDLVLAALRQVLVPGDLHHLLPVRRLVAAGQPGRTLSQGAQGGVGPRGLHKVPLHTRH